MHGFSDTRKGILETADKKIDYENLEVYYTAKHTNSIENNKVFNGLFEERGGYQGESIPKQIILKENTNNVIRVTILDISMGICGIYDSYDLPTCTSIRES